MYIFPVLFAVVVQIVTTQSVYQNLTVFGHYVTITQGDMAKWHVVETKIQNSTNILKGLPIKTDFNEIDLTDQDLPILFNNSVVGLEADILKISRCGLIDIEPNAISNSILQKLDVSKNKLEVVKRHYFSKNSIQNVDLSYNRIKQIEKGALESVGESDLKDSWDLDKSVFIMQSKPHSMPGEPEINLDGNQIETVEEGVFNNIKVRNLFLNNNQIKFLKPNCFVKMNAVGVLSLENNQIENITKNVFQSTGMRYLSLSNNSIKHIEKESFINLTKLEIIDLGQNQLQNIEKGVFNGLSLEKIELHENEISNIEQGAFEGLLNLTQLKLTGNKLKEINPGVFVNLKLTFLYLNGNDIENIRPGAFTNLEDMLILFLRNNSLVTINGEVFNNLPALEYMDLTGNTVCSMVPALQEKLPNFKRTVCNESELYIETVKQQYIFDRYLKDIYVVY